MEEDFINFLLAQSGITSLVSTRIYWNVRPTTSALPAITLQRISDIPSNDEQGADPLKETRIQVDCWGSSFATKLGVAGAINVARAVEAALSGKAFTSGNTEFQGIYIVGGGDTDEPGSTSGSVIHRSRVDYQVWHKEN